MEQLRQDSEPYKGQEYLNLLLAVLPSMGENLRIAQLCKGIGLTIEAIKELFNGESISFTGKLHSPEHNRDFDVQDAKQQILKERSEPNHPNKYRISFNGQNRLDWFKEQFQKVKQTVRPHIIPAVKSEINQSKGFKK